MLKLFPVVLNFILKAEPAEETAGNPSLNLPLNVCDECASTWVKVACRRLETQQSPSQYPNLNRLSWIPIPPFDSPADLGCYGCSFLQVVPTHISTTDLPHWSIGPSLSSTVILIVLLSSDVPAVVCAWGMRTFAPVKPVIKVWQYMWNHYTTQLPGDADHGYSRSKSRRASVIVRAVPLIGDFIIGSEVSTDH